MFDSLIEKLKAEITNRPNYEGKAYERGIRKAIGIIKEHTAAKSLRDMQPVGSLFEKWYGENVSAHFADEHCGTYHEAHAVFGSDVKAAWDAAIAAMQGATSMGGASCDVKDAVEPQTPSASPSEISEDDEHALVSKVFDAIWASSKYWRCLSLGKHDIAVTAIIEAIRPYLQASR